LSQRNINSLNKFKHNILINKKNVVFGKKLSEPPKIFSKIFNLNLQKMKKNKSNLDSLINTKTYNLFYHIINTNPILKNKNKNLTNISEMSKISFGKKNVKNKKEDLSIHKNKTIEEYKTLSPKKVNLYKPIKININCFQDNSKSRTKNNSNIKKSLSTCIKNDNKKGNVIQTISKFQKKYLYEKSRLKGYINLPLKGKIDTTRKKGPKYKSALDLFKKELELMKLVNPKLIEMEKDRDEKRLNFLKNKLCHKKF
jgi:hypothetical protein